MLCSGGGVTLRSGGSSGLLPDGVNRLAGVNWAASAQCWEAPLATILTNPSALPISLTRPRRTSKALGSASAKAFGVLEFRVYGSGGNMGALG